MRILIAPDKFKGSLSAAEAADAMSDGVLMADPSADVTLCPMADGGEGTLDAVLAAVGGELREKEVRGPLPGQVVQACWVSLPGGTLDPAGEFALVAPGMDPALPTAVIEMAKASGLALIPGDSRDPMVTSTFGTGQLIEQALGAGCRQIIVGIGGSGTVDGGTGMAAALGCRFFSSDGTELEPRGESLGSMTRIDTAGLDGRLAEAKVLVASDVDSPLVGEKGAALVYAPQKGATTEQAVTLDEGLRRYGETLKRELGLDLLTTPGAGAAGGLGAGLVAFCGADIISGVELVAALAGLEPKVRDADLVLTGEGSFDAQTTRGKAPAGVARIAAENGVPAIVVAGRLSGSEALEGRCVASFCVSPGPMELSEAVRDADSHLRTGTARLIRLLRLPLVRDASGAGEMRQST